MPEYDVTIMETVMRVVRVTGASDHDAAEAAKGRDAFVVSEHTRDVDVVDVQEAAE